MLETLSTVPVQPFTRSKSAKPHLGILDALRGLAALLVCLYHFTDGALPKFTVPQLTPIFAWGARGVDIFFVISGFIIPYSIWHTNYSVRRFGPYLVRRLLRICPPAYCLLLLTLMQWDLVDWLLHHTAGRLQAVTSSRLLANFLFAVPYTGESWFNAVFWTLAIELQFYVVLGVLFNWLFKLRPVPFLLASYALSAVYFVPGIAGHVDFFQFSPLFMMGAAGLLYYKKRYSGVELALVLAGLALPAAYLVTALSPIFGLATTLLIVGWQVKHPVGAYLGKISYSLYLTHFLSGSTFEYVLARFWPWQGAVGSSVAQLTILLLAIGAAHLFYLLVEQPFQLLSHRLLPSRAGKASAPAEWKQLYTARV